VERDNRLLYIIDTNERGDTEYGMTLFRCGEPPVTTDSSHKLGTAELCTTYSIALIWF
jgi:hypothetical protein